MRDCSSRAGPFVQTCPAMAPMVHPRFETPRTTHPHPRPALQARNDGDNPCMRRLCVLCPTASPPPPQCIRPIAHPIRPATHDHCHILGRSLGSKCYPWARRAYVSCMSPSAFTRRHTIKPTPHLFGTCRGSFLRSVVC